MCKKTTILKNLSLNQNPILSLCSNLSTQPRSQGSLLPVLRSEWERTLGTRLLSTYVSSIMSLNHRYSLLFIVSHADCYPPPLPCFSEYFKFSFSVLRTRQLCNRNSYVASVNTTQYGLRSLKFTGPRLWNSLPTSITNSNSRRIFRKTLKNAILKCYSN